MPRSRCGWDCTASHILTFTVSRGTSFPLNFTIHLYFLYTVFTALSVSKLISNSVRPTVSKYFKIKIAHSFRHDNGFWWSQWPRGVRRRSSAARLLRLWVRIPPGAWIFVCCECCVLSDRGLCDGLITRPEESYRLWRVVVCDQETSKPRRLKPATGL